MTDLPASTAPLGAGLPLAQGRCPACRGASLFLGSGGHVTCARIDCPNPSLADELLHGEQPAPTLAAAEATEPGRCLFAHAGHVACPHDLCRTCPLLPEADLDQATAHPAAKEKP